MHAVPMKKLPDRSAAIASALRTVATEQAGVAALAEALNNGLSEAFARAIELVSAIRGRVIVTGVGKSGHIGAKIAATLASTGTPAFFVHPAEANHGDLGMIAKDDAIIAMSWSGESAELKGIVAYSRRFSIPLIAITSGEGVGAGARGGCRAASAARARGLPARACADHFDAAATRRRRCAGCRAAGGARLHARPFPHLPSGRPARRQPDAGARDHASGRQRAGRRTRQRAARRHRDLVQEAVRLRLHRR